MNKTKQVKQVIVIRKDLTMRRGKEIAQGSHASMAVLLDMMTIKPSMAGTERTLKIKENSPLDKWLNGRFTKICVKCKDEAELLKLHLAAKEKKIPTTLITDAGLTEFKNIPTNTCIAIGPYWSDEIDKITGNLKLY